MPHCNHCPHVRWMVRRDMPDILAIERRAFEFPWSKDDFIHCLRHRNCIGMVAIDGRDDVMGFVVYELQKSRLDILNLAVRESLRRFGVGQAMIDKLKGKLSPDRRRELVADVRESNLPGHLFFKANGFRATHVLPEHYEAGDTDEDAYRFVYEVPSDSLGGGMVLVNQIGRLLGA